MNDFMKRFLPVVSAAVFVIFPALAEARSPVTHRTGKDFRELIVKGERPEIAACMVAAMNYVRTDEKFDAIRWGDDESEGAILREVENNAHLLRSIQFKSQLRSRAGGFFETWQQAEIICEQRDEESPQVRFTAIAR